MWNLITRPASMAPARALGEEAEDLLPPAVRSAGGEEGRVCSTTARQHRTPRPCPHLSYNPLPSDDPAVARAVEVLVITTPMPLQIKGELEVMLDRKQIDVQIAQRIKDQVIACDQLSHNRGSVEPRLQPVEPQQTLF